MSKFFQVCFGLITTLFLFSCSNSFERDNRMLFYSLPTSSSFFTIDLINRTSFVSEIETFDIVPISMEICEKTSDLLCFSEGVFPTFAIPRQIFSKTKTWHHKEVYFEINKSQNSPSGETLLTIAASKDAEFLNVFLFDSKFGLTTILFVEPGITTNSNIENSGLVLSYSDVLISDGIGFGANEVVFNNQ